MPCTRSTIGLTIRIWSDSCAPETAYQFEADKAAADVSQLDSTLLCLSVWSGWEGEGRYDRSSVGRRSNSSKGKWTAKVQVVDMGWKAFASEAVLAD